MQDRLFYFDFANMVWKAFQSASLTLDLSVSHTEVVPAWNAAVSGLLSFFSIPDGLLHKLSGLDRLFDEDLLLIGRKLVEGSLIHD